ncbi:MAG: metal ABC transporter permease [Planctomycetaceae bacterium]|nr:metal ABC transporter permease [Planctomycetaceae bacterium]
MTAGRLGPFLLMCVAMFLGLGGLPILAASVADTEQSHLQRVLLLQDYNTRVVLLGTTLLGISGGVIGVFMLLRKRSLIADVVGHSALPGIAMAFILCEAARPGIGRNVPLLMLGAALAGLLGAVLVMVIDGFSRTKSDAAMAIVLSTFYGLGTALLTVVQHLPTASAAGLKDYLNGKTASLVASDVWVFAICSAVLLFVTALLFKELTLLCFDKEFAAAEGWPVFRLDALLTALVVGITILGMQSVGLLLVVAVLIIPASAARFWSNGIRSLTIISGTIGGLSAACGTIISALYPRIAAGAVIVLSGTAFFVVSMLFGRQRGLIWTVLEARRMQRRIGRHDLLRAAYEIVEADCCPDRHQVPSDAQLLNALFSHDQLIAMRTWSARRVRQLVQSACQHELLIPVGGSLRLTPEGAALARRAVRNHRLWELYLITFAEVAPSRVDRAADRIEHVLEPDVIRQLELRLTAQQTAAVPQSPHD